METLFYILPLIRHKDTAPIERQIFRTATHQKRIPRTKKILCRKIHDTTTRVDEHIFKESHIPRVKHIVTTADKYFFTPKYNRIPPKLHSMLLDNPLKQLQHQIRQLLQFGNHL